MEELRPLFLAFLSITAITILLACGPEASPLAGNPTPTPTQPPPLVFSHLAWFDSPPTSIHFSAKQSIESIWNSDPELGATVAQLAWVVDGIADGESSLLAVFADLAGAGDPSSARLAEELMDADRVHDGVTFPELRLLDRLLHLSQEAGNDLTPKQWFADGINAEDLALAAVLHEKKGRSLIHYQDLLDSNNVRTRTVSLPLAGEIELLVVRHSPFLESDNTIDLLQTAAQWLEAYMEIPFPWNPVVLGIIEESELGIDWAGPAYAAHDQLASVGWEYYGDALHLPIFHEMSHIYWGGHTGASSWFLENVAVSSLNSYVRRSALRPGKKKEQPIISTCIAAQTESRLSGRRQIRI